MSESAEYNPELYERPSVTVDVVIFALSLAQEDLQVLLIRRKQWPYQDQWGLPGGFIQLDESLEQAASRQLEAKTGVTSVYMEQLYTFGALARDPRTRVITVTYFALVPYTSVKAAFARSEGQVAWRSVFDLEELAFDHVEIIEYAYRRLRYKLEYTTVGFELLPNEFTLTELQTAYEIILRESIDKRNFRRKILSAEILEEVGSTSNATEGRPAKLYRYRDNAITEIKARRLFP